MSPKQKKGSAFNPLGLKKSSDRPLPKSSKSLIRSKTTKSPKKRRFKFTWKKFFISIGFILGFLVLLTASVFAYYVRELPNPKKIENRNIVQSTEILDRNGTNLYNIHGDFNRTVVNDKQISDYSKEATVSVEDADFYHHHGFSITGILRAVRDHVTHSGLGGGGSTITQQYVKNTLPEVGNAYSLSRKIKELILAVEVEQIYSKDEILTGYLNAIPYGGSAYGIEAASRVYFGKDAKDLTLSEAATLASVPQSPTYYSPYGNHLDQLFERKNYVLDRMVDQHYITQEEADKAKTQAPSKGNLNFKEQTDLLAPHFVFYVREKLIGILDPDPQVAEQKLDQGGYKVTTSLDLQTQQLAQKIVSEEGLKMVKNYNASNASLSAVDPKTGEILAMVGSIDYQNSESGNTNFATANLQPGSSFKPIVYATAFNEKYKKSPSSIVYDLPTDFGNYKPNNYNGRFNGAVTDRTALDESLNIPAVKNLALVGVNDAISTAKSMGISTLDAKKNNYGLSLVLGSGEVKPIEMADAYATFANGGKHNKLRPILKIEKDGQVIQDFTQAEPTQAITPEVAYEISNVLSDNNARAPVFGVRNNLTLGADRPVAAKSGTTENNRDGWLIGYTPSISVAVWVGNNEPNKTMTRGGDGSVVAGPIWNRFMREYLTGKPVEKFTRPSTIKDITVDKLSGKLPTDQSPPNERITDIFAPWQAPTTSDNIHVKVKVVKGTNKLATDLTPENLVEEKTYFNIHSERPDDPRWEQPVQNWCRNTYGDRCGSPPTETDDQYTTANIPTVSFVSPSNGATVGSNLTVQVTPGGTKPISQVDFSVDGKAIGTVTAAPWKITHDISGLKAGSHIISAKATNNLGLSKAEQVTVKYSSSAGGDLSPITGAQAIDGISGVKNISLSWNNPSSSSAVSVKIYYSNSAGSLGSVIKTVATTSGTSSTTSIALPAGTYYFTLYPVDADGNENKTTTSDNQVSAKVIN